jgi:hypothetical protein
MNDRIQELKHQAGIDDNPDQGGLDLFASLIVEECAQVADTERPGYLGCGYITKTTGMRIKEHFGVQQ